MEKADFVVEKIGLKIQRIATKPPEEFIIMREVVIITHVYHTRKKVSLRDGCHQTSTFKQLGTRVKKRPGAMAEWLWHPAPNPKVGGSTPHWTTPF